MSKQIEKRIAFGPSYDPGEHAKNRPPGLMRYVTGYFLYLVCVGLLHIVFFTDHLKNLFFTNKNKSNVHHKKAN